ncbi:MAG: 50S ribosomal protein L31e [Candidatus Nitrosotenuis sp.]
MSQEAERVYTINLGKVWLSPNNQRAKRAINMIKEFSRRHMKTEQIKIDQELSHLVWQRGIRSPPRKVRVRMSKTDEGYVVVSPYEEGVTKSEEKTKEKKSKTEAKEKPKTEEKPNLEDKTESAKDDAKTEDEQEKPQLKTKKTETKKEEKPKKEGKSSDSKKPAKKSK